MISQQLARKINKGMLSQYPIIYIAGREEDRIQATLSSIAKKKYGEKQPLISWSLFQGFSDTNDMLEPLQALNRISATQQPTMYLLKDFPAELDDPIIIRAVRDLYYALKNKNIYIFFSYPTVHLPEILNNEIYLVEMALPSEAEIHTYFQHFIEVKKLTDKISTSVAHQYTIALMGLTLNEIEHLLVRLLSSKNQNFEQLLPEVQQEKSQILKKESCLQFISTQQSLEQIGGLDNLKEWVLQRKDLFTEEAFNSGLPLPSGILFMGVSGCGKSMAAKAIATAWNVPLVRLDMSLVLSGAYGPPEVAFAHATRIAEEISPIVLWIDELENSFGYDEQSPGQGNINIFSSFLTWMQDKSPKIFLAATANRIKQIPAELMRKGRFDQLFFLDLPNKEERHQILKIHIALQGADPDSFDLGYLSVLVKEWSGAEIEQAIKSARIDAYQEHRDFTDQDIEHTATNMVPLAQTMKEQIKEIKDWSFNRAAPASKK
ncbi:MAG: AAA family ATPase [Gammaproteobacteria bacterium]|nr:AAA family ATPase [Gammaproteobacteria bacterium]